MLPGTVLFIESDVQLDVGCAIHRPSIAMIKDTLDERRQRSRQTNQAGCPENP